MVFNVQLGPTNGTSMVTTSLGSNTKPRVSLTVPNCNHFARLSLMVLDIFLDAIAKAKKLIRSFTDKEFFSFVNGV